MADIPIFPNGLDADGQPLKNLGAAVDVDDAVTLQQLNDAIVGGLTFKGGYDAATNTPDLETPAPGAVLQGDFYVVTAAGTFFTEAVEDGDTLFAKVDDPAALTDWVRIEKNGSGGATPTFEQVLTAGNTSGANNVLINAARLGVGETSPTARVHIKGETADSSTNSLYIYNAANERFLRVLNDNRGIFGDTGTGVETGHLMLLGYSQNFIPTTTNDTYNLAFTHSGTGGGAGNFARIGTAAPSAGFSNRDGADLYVEAGSVASTCNNINSGGNLYLRSGRPGTNSGGTSGNSNLYLQTGTTAGNSQRGTWATAVTINGSQNVGFGLTPSNDAVIEVKAGTATTAPIKLTAGTNLTTPVNGALEFDGTNLYITIAGVRRTIQVV